ncbi:nucleotidyl transferase AbiEii/AbiGii toxin family protein [Membranihabitans maritimus]|uniref:nucleotidyl transferase AbiEii/AbiGii toxin family protein n=1 Tax=Membranihabitans maritimus TaxID=2904244 RepID=UPI001F2541FE|nr:nucleotidyl transferase AbiEii/AbiGii toxin family protein [Membranihabitans maritimus]
MNNFLQLEDQRKALIFSQTAVKTSMPSYVIEKDWWVTEMLRIVFSLPYAHAFVFKGGTSLSKGYHLIHRFSEDIDLAVDRAFFDMSGDLSRNQISKLRKASARFVRIQLIEDIKQEIAKKGLPVTEIGIEPFNDSDTDPLRIYITYTPLTEENKYVTPQVLLEISCRSLREPCEEVPIQSFIDQEYPNTDFTNPPFLVRTVQPQRTFLEKVFLLHEEWQKDRIRVTRLSRHLYDLEHMMDTPFAKKALTNKELYFHIVDHRRKFTPIRGIDYTNHHPKNITILPPDRVSKEYEDDYNEMKESMFPGNTATWKELTQKLFQLQQRIQALDW